MASSSFMYAIAVVLICVEMVAGDYLSPSCSISFQPAELSANQLIVKNLGAHEYHVHLAGQHQNPRVNRVQGVLERKSRIKLRRSEQGFPLATIECLSVQVLDFEFHGVEALQYIRILKSRNVIQGHMQQKIVIVAELTPNATGEYILYSKESSRVQSSFFIFAETEHFPQLLGQGRRLVVKLDGDKVTIPCVSPDPNQQMYLYRRVNSDNVYTPLTPPAVMYNRQQGFVLPRIVDGVEDIVGDYRCTTADTFDPSSGYLDIDVKQPLPTGDFDHPQLYISLYQDGGAECVGPQGSEVQLVRVKAEPYEGPALAQCFQQQNKLCGTRAQDPVFGAATSKRSTSGLSSFDHAGYGILICYTQDPSETVYTPFLRALNGIYYKKVTEIPIDQLLRVKIHPNTNRLDAGTEIEIASDSAPGAFFYDPRIYFARYNNGTVLQIGEISYWSKQPTIMFLLTANVDAILATDVFAQTGRTLEVSRPLTISIKRCGPNEFLCSSDECIGMEERCDHYVDCVDGQSDEINCTNYTRGCASSEFKCASGQCIADFKLCNGGTPDCFDASDEDPKQCSGCAKGYFKCRNGECIRDAYLCDSDKDCSDGSDEFFQICRNCNGDPNKFKCRVGGCILKERVCNGEANCDDQSDETPVACQLFIPRIVNSRSTYTFARGEDHYVVCEVRIPSSAAASPRFIPHVIWKSPINSSSNDVKPVERGLKGSSTMVKQADSESEDAEFAFIYRLSEFEVGQAGIYTCVAQNEIGSTERDFTVMAHECSTKPNKPGRPHPPSAGPEDVDSVNEGPGEVDGPHFEPVPEDNYLCEEPGKFPDTHNCAVFHECVKDKDESNLVPHRFECGPGTVYCPENENCGWERNCPCDEKRFNVKKALKLKNRKFIRRRY